MFLTSTRQGGEYSTSSTTTTGFTHISQAIQRASSKAPEEIEDKVEGS
jgi:hypothetical protein